MNRHTALTCDFVKTRQLPFVDLPRGYQWQAA
jgi:hypothetical protein